MANLAICNSRDMVKTVLYHMPYSHNGFHKRHGFWS